MGNLIKKIRDFIADKRGKANLAEILGEVLLFVVLVPVIGGLVSGLVNASTGTAAVIYGLTTTFLAIIFFYVIYKQIKKSQ
jgi:lysozyme family protein